MKKSFVYCLLVVLMLSVVYIPVSYALPRLLDVPYISQNGASGPCFLYSIAMVLNFYKNHGC